MIHKKQKRLRRARGIRARIKDLSMPRLTVHRTLNHMYAQIISPEENCVLVSASTVEKELKSELKNFGNKSAAASVGKLIAERALKADIKKVAFDRSGFKYHGRVKALAEAAREQGLEF
ncbi:MAG: 50S ribosomal protein L18 [Gammaproteobacteria bacterium RIFOXYB2_FULL_38_6]|nr:MAG: 50S ribosomal protein L18 [Gammaproteobacteria bacterium RIFOXYB2_FULL_38_6]